MTRPDPAVRLVITLFPEPETPRPDHSAWAVLAILVTVFAVLASL